MLNMYHSKTVEKKQCKKVTITLTDDLNADTNANASADTNANASANTSARANLT